MMIWTEKWNREKRNRGREIGVRQKWWEKIEGKERRREGKERMREGKDDDEGSRENEI